MEETEKHAREWMDTLGALLLDQVLESMQHLGNRTQELEEGVGRPVTNLDQFKSVMGTISDVKKMTVQAEVRYSFCQVRTLSFFFPED